MLIWVIRFTKKYIIQAICMFYIDVESNCESQQTTLTGHFFRYAFLVPRCTALFLEKLS